jgi:hypothetical protein
MKTHRVEQTLESAEQKRKQKKKTLDKSTCNDASNNFETLLDEAEDDARLEALDLESQ